MQLLQRCLHNRVCVDGALCADTRSRRSGRHRLVLEPGTTTRLYTRISKRSTTRLDCIPQFGNTLSCRRGNLD